MAYPAASSAAVGTPYDDSMGLEPHSKYQLVLIKDLPFAHDLRRYDDAAGLWRSEADRTMRDRARDQLRPRHRRDRLWRERRAAIDTRCGAAINRQLPGNLECATRIAWDIVASPPDIWSA